VARWDCPELDRGEAVEGLLSASAVVGLLDPDHDRQPQLVTGVPPHAPTRPNDPIRPADRRAVTYVRERNWPPRSECTIAPRGDRRAVTEVRDGVAQRIHREVELALAGRVLGDVNHFMFTAGAVKSRATRSSCTGGPALRLRPRFLACAAELRGVSVEIDRGVGQVCVVPIPA